MAFETELTVEARPREDGSERSFSSSHPQTNRHTTTFGSMVQRSKIRALEARDRGSNPRRPIVPRWSSLVGRLPATEVSCKGFPGSNPGRGVLLSSRVGEHHFRGETSRQVTALGLKLRAERLRSSTLRLTVGGVSLVRPRDRAGTTVPVRARVFKSPSRRQVDSWSNGKTPASRAGDGCSIRSESIFRGSQAVNGGGLKTR